MLKNLLLLSLIATSLLAENNQGPQIVVEPDQTDIYAIPLDEDAQDQQEELESLEHPNRK